LTRFVLDCSVAMSWCFEDEADAYADRALDALDKGEAHVPSLWLLETANVLIVSERRGRLTEADSSRFVELLMDLPIFVDEEAFAQSMPAMLAHSRAYGLTSYDAAYLDLAMRLGLPLATRDKSLQAACKKSGVKVFK
jgi:predicted nucleic acid-binding protein